MRPQGKRFPCIAPLFTTFFGASFVFFSIAIATYSNQSSLIGRQSSSIQPRSLSSWPLALPTAPWPFTGVQGCRSESDETICPWCNATFSQQHPLGHDDFSRAYTAGDHCRMPCGLFQRLATGSSNLAVTVVGGSMTEGVNCFDSLRNRSRCAWPSRMEDRLKHLFPDAKLSVRNVARPSWSYSTWLESGMIDELVKETDVLIIDLQVNSQVYKHDIFRQMEEADLFIYELISAAKRQRQTTGFLFVENFLTCGNFTALCDAHCPEHRQGRMTYNFVGLNMTYGYCNRWWTIQTMERPILEHYQLPAISYREAVWPDFARPSQLLPCFWNGYSHPDAVGHLLMGDVVTYGFLRALIDSNHCTSSCKSEQLEPVRFHQRLPPMRYCTPSADTNSHLATYMTAAKPQGFQPIALTGAWSFKEDRVGKPGWILEPANSTNQAHSGGLNGGVWALINTTAAGGLHPSIYNEHSIWFEVTFSNQPQLQVSYLTSYSSVGVAELSLYNSSFSNSTALATYILDGRIKDRYSIPRTTTLIHPTAQHKPLGKLSQIKLLPAEVQQGTYVVALRPANGTRLNGSKFKVLGLSSC